MNTHNSKDFEGRVAIITGAAGSIGRAIAKRLSAGGATLALCDRDPELEQFAATLGERHSFWIGDLGSEESISSHVAMVKEKHSQIDILINNAAYGGTLDSAEQKSTSEFDQSLLINLRAPFLYAREAGKHMIANGYGRIINIGSMAAVIGIEGHVAYSATKAGLLGVTNCLAVEWGKYGITANCISPTIVETPMGMDAWDGEVGENAKARIPVGRFAQPDEIASAVIFLASEETAMINGANLMVDGGYTIR